MQTDHVEVIGTRRSKPEPASTTEPRPGLAIRAATAPAKPRDRFLDLLRLVSVLRVVALHTCTKPPVVYLPWIQWIFPGMPEVFFVSGAVTAAALRRRPPLQVVRKRLRRLFPPYAVYAVVALAVMAVTDARSTAPAASLDRGDWFSFLVPVVRPTGSTTRVILWGHLWFLTAFLWVIALSPFTYWLHGKMKAWSLFVPGLLFLLVVVADKKQLFTVREEMYNVTMFGWFFQLGYLYDDDTLQRLKVRTHIIIAAALGASGWMVAERIEPVWKKSLNELYSSQSGHLLVGAAWMFLAFAFRVPIMQWLKTHRARFVDVVTQRTYTLFIWGPAANAVAMAASRKIGGDGGSRPVYFGVTAVMLAGLVLTFGFVEDWASSRRPRLLPAI